MPAEDLDRLIEGRPGRGEFARGEDTWESCAEALAQPDHVVHRHAATTVQGGGPLGVLAGLVRLVELDAEGDPIGQQLGVAQQVAQAGLVVPPLHRRVGIHGDAQRTGGESLLVGPDTRGGLGEPGIRVGGRQAETRVTHDG